MSAPHPALDLLESLRVTDEFRGGERTISVDVEEGILTVLFNRDADWSRDQDSRFETRTFRLVEVEPAWVEVQR